MEHLVLFFKVGRLDGYIQSKYDTVIPADSYRFIATHIGSQKKEVQLVDEGNHALTADTGKEYITQMVQEFVRK